MIPVDSEVTPEFSQGVTNLTITIPYRENGYSQ